MKNEILNFMEENNKPLDIELLNRVKDEIAKDNLYNNWEEILMVNRFWPEVCRRYAEEVNKMDFKTQIETDQPLIEIQKREISQLKKQLEEKEQEIEDEYKLGQQLGVEARSYLDKLELAKMEIESLKSKLEVKEKPDCKVYIDSSAIVELEIRLETAHKVIDLCNSQIAERDAKIAELENRPDYDVLSDLQAQNKSLAESYSKLQIRFGESESELNECKAKNKSLLDKIAELENDIAEKDEKIKELEYWKKQEIELIAPLFEWGQSQKDLPVGTSITKEILKRLENYSKLESELKEADRQLIIKKQQIENRDAIITELQLKVEEFFKG